MRHLAPDRLGQHAATDIVLAAIGAPSATALSRELDGMIADHRTDAAGRLSFPAAEFDAEIATLDELAGGVALAGRALARLTANNICGDGPRQSPQACADLIDGALDGLLTAPAARVLSAAIRLRLAEAGR